jgi:hypothetical protein
MSKPGSPTLDSLRANRPEARPASESITSDDIRDAAEALRSVEIEAAREDFEADTSDTDTSDTVEWSGPPPVEEEFVIPVNLEELSIDELRAVAGMLRIPDYVKITDQEELMAIIRTYAEPAPKPR